MVKDIDSLIEELIEDRNECIENIRKMKNSNLDIVKELLIERNILNSVIIRLYSYKLN